MKKEEKINKVGIIIGTGTGREIADIFINSVDHISRLYKKKIVIEECKHIFSTYHNSKKYSLNKIAKIVQKDINTLNEFYKKFYKTGGRAIFRTAINAETLYKFREIGKAVKTITFPFKKNKLLLIRDEMQGFYTNDEYYLRGDELTFLGKFSKVNFETIFDFSLNEAKSELNSNFDVWFVYKYHLFANLLEAWSIDILDRIKVYQPNHATDELYKRFKTSGENKDLLLIAGNEFGDIIHEILIFKFKIGTRFTIHSRNVYLHPESYNLVEYQTVHGSADDIAGKGIVNPFATLAAAGNYIEEQLKIPSFGQKMSNAIKRAIDNQVYTHDMGGGKKSSEVVYYVLNEIEKISKNNI